MIHGSTDLLPSITCCWILMIMLDTCCQPIHGSIQFDKCEEASNCSIQVNRSSLLHCSVKYMEACESVFLTEKPEKPVQIEPHLLLSSLSVYMRSYHDFQIPSLNFSFILSPAAIDDNTVGAVMVKFESVSGYYSNTPVCRLFNFSGSSLTQAEMGHTQVEISYPCIGINIAPNVFHLNLTSVPTLQRLDYVITWEPPVYSLDYYDEPYLQFQGDVWVSRMVSVAAMPQQKCLHVVFQPPDLKADIKHIQVSLQNEVNITEIKQVKPIENSVTFRDVESGHYYKVRLGARGDVCDHQPEYCKDVTSEPLWLPAAAEETGKNNEDGDTVKSSNLAGVLVGAILGVFCFLSIVVVSVILLQRRWKSDDPTKCIIVYSATSRELEKNVAKFFCSFLSEALNTSVTLSFPINHEVSELEYFTFPDTNDPEPRQRLLFHSDRFRDSQLYKRCGSHIILRFSYHLRSFSPTSASDIYDGHYYSCSNNNDLPAFISSLKLILVTFVSTWQKNGDDLVYSAQSVADVEESMFTDDQITVLQNQPKKLNNEVSLCNKEQISCESIPLTSGTGEYFLPRDIMQLLSVLKSSVSAKAVESSVVFTDPHENWTLALAVFRKAVENQPNDSPISYPDQSEVFTILDTNTEKDFPGVDLEQNVVKSSKLHSSERHAISQNKVSKNFQGVEGIVSEPNNSFALLTNTSVCSDDESFSNFSDFQKDLLKTAQAYYPNSSVSSEEPNKRGNYNKASAFSSARETNNSEALAMPLSASDNFITCGSSHMHHIPDYRNPNYFPVISKCPGIYSHCLNYGPPEVSFTGGYCDSEAQKTPFRSSGYEDSDTSSPRCTTEDCSGSNLKTAYAEKATTCSESNLSTKRKDQILMPLNSQHKFRNGTQGYQDMKHCRIHDYWYPDEFDRSIIPPIIE